MKRLTCAFCDRPIRNRRPFYAAWTTDFASVDYHPRCWQRRKKLANSQDRVKLSGHPA